MAGNAVGDTGAQALATLKDSTTLRTLTIDLSYNQISDAGAEALAMLKELKSLHTLTPIDLLLEV